MTTPHHDHTRRAVAHRGLAGARHATVPRLHEGWLRIASVLQPLRWWAHGRHGRVTTPAPSACLIFRH